MLRYAAGLVPDQESRDLAQHLDSCDACRAEYQRLTSTDSPLPKQDVMLSGIQDAIQQWNTEKAPQKAGPRLRRRVVREIAPYLGSRASAHILGGVSDSGENLLS